MCWRGKWKKLKWFYKHIERGDTVSKGEKILRLMQYLEKLDDEQIDEVNKTAEACLIVQTLKNLKTLGVENKN